MLDNRLNARDQVILTRLALHLNLKTGRCDPSVDRLASEVSINGRDPRRQARRSLAKGEKIGWIRRSFRHGGDAGKQSQTSRYALTIPSDIAIGLQSPIAQAERSDKKGGSDRTKSDKAIGLLSPPNSEDRTEKIRTVNIKNADLEFDKEREGERKEARKEARNLFPFQNPLLGVSARPPIRPERWWQERTDAQATLDRYRAQALAANEGGGGLIAGSSIGGGQ
jgi:hypothetical protein